MAEGYLYDRAAVITSQLKKLKDPVTAPVVPYGDQLDMVESARWTAGSREDVTQWICSDLAWDMRVGGWVPETIPAAHIRTLSVSDATELAYLELERLRFDFRLAELSARADAWIAHIGALPTLQVYKAFALCAQCDPAGIALAMALKDDPAISRGLYTLLQGLWFGFELPDQAQHMLAVCESIRRAGMQDANYYYWTAYALRMMGQYTGARQHIDHAIGLLTPGQGEVLQDYVRERELIATAANLDSVVRGAVRQALSAEAGRSIRA